MNTVFFCKDGVAFVFCSFILDVCVSSSLSERAPNQILTSGADAVPMCFLCAVV